MWFLFAVPIVIFVALMLAGMVFAGVFWVIGASWPWLLIGLGMWLFWRGDGRHRRARRHRLAWETGGQHARSDRHARPVWDQPAGEQRSARKEQAKSKTPGESELPIDIRVKVEQIRRKVDVLLGYADRFPPFSQDLYLVRQTASDYLPRTIDTYLAMADKQAAEKPMTPEGKTPHQELK